MSIQKISFTSTIQNNCVDTKSRDKMNANIPASQNNIKGQESISSPTNNDNNTRNWLLGLGGVATITALGFAVCKRNLKPINKKLEDMTRSELAENILTAINKKEYVTQHASRGESIDYNGFSTDVLNKIWHDFSFSKKQGIVRNTPNSRLRREVIYAEHENQPYTLIAHELFAGRVGDYISLYLKGKIPEDFAFEIAEHMGNRKYGQTYLDSVKEWLSGIIKK